MRLATTELVANLWKKYGERVMQEPWIDLGGAESTEQYKGVLPRYQVWDIRDLPGVSKVVDARTMWSSGDVKANSVGTLISFDMLEHVYEIFEVVEQIGRVVFPTGVVLIGLPWMGGFHDPSGDYWRISPKALELMFAKDFRLMESGFYDMGSCGHAGSFYMGRRTIGTREPGAY